MGMQRFIQTTGLALLTAAVIGCGNIGDLARNSGEAPAGANDTAETTGNDTAPAPANNAGGGGGEFDGLVIDNARAVNPGGGSPATNKTPAPTPQPTAQASIPKEDARVVDMRMAMADNSDLKIVKNEAQGQDPISFAANAYVTLSTKAYAAAFQRELQLQQQLNGGEPISYEQFMKSVNQMNIDFNKLPPYRMYGYDTKTGQIVILEDTAMKKRLYEEKGIPLDE